MPDAQVKAIGSTLLLRGIKRVAVLLLVATAFTWVLNHSGTAKSDNGEPAGFARGMLHGALMPGSLPHLLLGQDVTIYAENNNGRLYKLGYTVGVNGCGALFFGVFFWRFSRWRKKLAAHAASNGNAS